MITRRDLFRALAALGAASLVPASVAEALPSEPDPRLDVPADDDEGVWWWGVDMADPVRLDTTQISVRYEALLARSWDGTVTSRMMRSKSVTVEFEGPLFAVPMDGRGQLRVKMRGWEETYDCVVTSLHTYVHGYRPPTQTATFVVVEKEGAS